MEPLHIYKDIICAKKYICILFYELRKVLRNLTNMTYRNEGTTKLGKVWGKSAFHNNVSGRVDESTRCPGYNLLSVIVHYEEKGKVTRLNQDKPIKWNINSNLIICIKVSFALWEISKTKLFILIHEIKLYYKTFQET